MIGAIAIFVVAVILAFVLCVCFGGNIKKQFYSVLAIVVLAAFSIVGSLFAGPYYAVFQQKLVGEAEFKRAEQNRKVKIEEARADKESAVMLAEAEVERAKGVAKANEIIGDSLKGNEAYLRYLWINGLHKNQQTIYVPTETGLPILEAGRLKK